MKSKTKFEKVDQLIEDVLKENPSHQPFLLESMEGVSESEYAELESYLTYCSNRGHDSAFVAACYNVVVNDMFEEQIYFMRHKRYRAATRAEVENQVYHNPEYMQKYMYGVAITLVLWPTHRELHRFFHEMLPKSSEGNYLEIGAGHGLYFMAAMRDSSYQHYTALDLSETSLRMTREVVESSHFGEFSNYDLRLGDFLDMDITPAKYSAVVAGYVLEHVDHPIDFLRKIREVTTPDALIFLTTCINAPAVDHVLLLESIDELKELVGKTGLSWKQDCVAPYPRLTLEETLEMKMPLNIAMVLGHE